MFYYSPNREGDHPQRQLANYTGIMQADAYAGFDALYVAGPKPGPILEAACWLLPWRWKATCQQQSQAA